MREVGQGLVRALTQKGISPADLVKAVRKGQDGQTITDLSQLAQFAPGRTDEMGAPFATTADPGDAVFSAAGMGPGAPARPFPLGGEPRQWQYRTGFNFPTPPNSDRGVDSALLRLLADQYDLLRQCIELSKNEIAALEWDIVPREKNRKKREQILQAEGDEITRLKQFFEWPEAYMAKTKKGEWVRRGKVPWQQWISAQLEEYFVGDWLTIWPRVMMGGQLLGFDRVDGSTIKPLIDSEGRQPAPPYPAWQQYLYGVPRASFTLEELLYRPKVLRNFTVYGFSHVEQMLLLINLALRYQMWLSSGYTDGSIPVGVLEFPENFSADMIKELVDELNAATGGLSDSRQQWHGVPSGTKWHEMRPFTFDAQFAGWLVEYTCSLFGYSAQKLGFMPSHGHSLGGTGFAQQQDKNADSSEKIPTAGWVKQLMNELLDRCLGRPDLEFLFVDLEQQDETEQITADGLALNGGLKSWDQILQERGEEPVGVSEPFVVIGDLPYSVADIKAIQEGGQRTPAPGVPLSVDDIGRQKTEDEKPPPVPFGGHPAAPPAPGGKPEDPGAPAAPSSGAAPGKPGEAPGPAKPSPAGDDAAKFDTSSGMQPHDLGPSRVEELQRWKRKSTKDVREGRAPRPFRSELIPAQMKTAIATELGKASTLGEARATFDLRITKAAAKETSVAGLVVLADDTGRVLLIQRSNADAKDPARGTWEFPGGHLEGHETPIEGAMREWREETGIVLPSGEVRGQWKDGLYEGFIYAIPAEADLPLNPDPGNRHVLNPDDPDGDDIETAAWWNPADLPEMPALREECGATPWPLIDEATPATASKAATASVTKAFLTVGRAWLAGHNYRPADDQNVSCGTCSFFVDGVCTMAPGDPAVETDEVCDEWVQSRKARTETHEKQIAAGVLAVTGAKLARAQGSTVALRETLVMTDADIAALEAAIADGSEASYLAGLNRALEQLGQPAIDRVGLAGQTSLSTAAQNAAVSFSQAWQDQLDQLISLPELDPEQVADAVRGGLDRFAGWKSSQIAVTNAANAYNDGKMESYRLHYTVGSMYEWDTAGDDAVCEDCQDRADGGPYSLEDLDVGELHPGDRCEVNVVQNSDDDQGDDDEDSA